jgi:hypothetical protein
MLIMLYVYTLIIENKSVFVIDKTVVVPVAQWFDWLFKDQQKDLIILSLPV